MTAAMRDTDRAFIREQLEPLAAVYHFTPGS
jgi:hypothetical protein